MQRKEDRDSVAACAVCGMGLCMERTIEREIPLVERVSGWASERAMHIVCDRYAKLGLTA